MDVSVALVIAVVAAARGSWSPCGLSMVSAINPISERARGYRYPVTALWYVAGAVAGGAVLGGVAAAGAWGAAPLQGHPALGTGFAVAACLVAAASDIRLGGFALPE